LHLLAALALWGFGAYVYGFLLFLPGFLVGGYMIATLGFIMSGDDDPPMVLLLFLVCYVVVVVVRRWHRFRREQAWHSWTDRAALARWFEDVGGPAWRFSPGAAGGMVTPAAISLADASAGACAPQGPPRPAERKGLGWGWYVALAVSWVIVATCLSSTAKSPCKAKQTEAKGGLKSIYTTQLAYSGEFGTYLDLNSLTSFGGLDELTISKARFYEFTVTADRETFSATARDTRQPVKPSQGPGADVWHIDQGGYHVRSRSDACVRQWRWW
jgi:hypothetical protein